MPGNYRFTITIDADGNVAVKALDQVAKAAEKTGKESDIMRGMMERAGQRITDWSIDILKQLPQVAMETVQLGIQADAARGRFERFAGSSELATGYLEAMQRASYGTVDSLGAMQSATKLLQMGLVDDADEMESVAKIAMRLGDQTASATDRMGDFALMLANQSIMRLDNFGISSGKVRVRIEELQKSIKGLSREEAFKIAAIEEGTKALDLLGDQSGTTANKIAILKTAIKEAQIGFGEMAVEAIDTTANVNVLAEHIKALPDLFETGRAVQNLVLLNTWTGNLKTNWQNAIRIADDFVSSLEGVESGTQRVKNAFDDQSRASEDLRYQVDDVTESTEDLKWEMPKLSYETRQYLDDLAEYETVGNDAIYVTDNFAGAMENLRIEQEQAAQALREFTFEGGMAFTDYWRNTKRTAEDYQISLEDLEAEHQKNLENIQKKGQSTRVQVDAEAEEAKLADLKRRLEYALMEEADFTDKTKEVTRMRKADQIAELQSQIGDQEKLLDDYYNGRLWKQGKNIDDELAAEQARYDEGLENLKASHALQEEENRRAWGNMLLQWWDTWATMNGVSSDKAMEMRIAIAEEYGLLDETGARTMESMVAGWQSYADGSVTSAEVVIKQAEAVKSAIENMPSLKTITIETRMRQITESGGGFVEEFPGEGEAAPAKKSEQTPATVKEPGKYTPPKTPTTENPFQMQHGGVLTVPSGYPNDSYIIGVSSGETVMVRTAAQKSAYEDQLNRNVAAGFGLPGGGQGIGIMPMPTTGAGEVLPGTTTTISNSTVIQITIRGDVWSDQKVREIADRINLLLPKSGVIEYTGVYQR